MNQLSSRFSEYCIMWVLVFFDMPTETKRQRKEYASFRKQLLKDGFKMFQFSIYIRNCPSMENADMHRRRIKAFKPEYGDIGILTITDKQFAAIELLHGYKKPVPTPVSVQLELF